MNSSNNTVSWTEAVSPAHLFHAIFTHGTDCLLLLEVSSERKLIVLDLNPTAERTFGVERVHARGRPIEQFIRAHQARDLAGLAWACLDEQCTKRYELVFELLEGPRTLNVQLIPVTRPAGTRQVAAFVRRGHQGGSRDPRLNRNIQVFRTLVENSSDTIARYDLDGIRIYANPAFVRQAGVPPSELIGKTPSQFPGGPKAEQYQQHIRSVVESHQETQFELTWQNHEGTERCNLIRLTPEFDIDRRLISVLAVGRDITDIDQYRKKTRRLAYYDTLSSLPNRSLFYSRLRRSLDEAGSSLTGLIMMDIDRFKVINDSLGHIAGDVLLRKIAGRLKRQVGKAWFVARVGGDEFAVILPKLPDRATLGYLTQSILGVFREPYRLADRELFVTASLGITLFPDHGTSGDDLIMYADSAMYHAKTRAERFAFYESGMTLGVTERMTLEAELRKALQRDELRLHYQPKVCLENNTLVGCEALVRWQHPERGLLTPGHFIGIAEETHMILELGDWVLRTACRDAARWNRRASPCRVAINLSAHQFEDPGLVHRIDDILLATECRPEWIELEITESLLLADRVDTRKSLEALRHRGINIAIDDFGTGYSALNYLTRFPINVLKIDQSFVRGITGNMNNQKLVNAIIYLAKGLDIVLVAEGIESASEAAYLKAMGCQFGQGYHYSKPVDCERFGAWLTGQRDRPDSILWSRSELTLSTISDGEYS